MTDAVIEQGGNPAPASEGPKDFYEAFAADISPVSDPAPDAPESAQPAETAATSATVPGPVTGEDDRSPFIPRSRFDEVNTRLKDAELWKKDRSWAEGVSSENFNQMASWFLRAQSDTRGFALSLLDELAQHPEHGPAIRSELARRLGTRPQGAAPDASPSAATMPDPDVAITDANGQVVGRTYSAEGLAKRDAFIQAQILQGVDAKYAPHLNVLQQIQQREQDLALRQQANDFGTTFASELAALPGFAEHKAEIGSALKALNLTSDSPDAIRAATYQLYAKIVVPTLRTTGQSAAVADLQRKAAASTSVNPAAATAPASKRVDSFHDKSLAWT